MRTLKASAIGENHPSFGCGRAAFLFGKICSEPFRSVTELILVEVYNEWAVQTMERILVLFGNKINPEYEILSVFRDTQSIGLRNDAINEMEYINFMIDVVNPACLINDPVTAHAFDMSLSGEDRNKALRLLNKLEKTPTPPVDFKIQEVSVPKPEPIFSVTSIKSDNYDKALAAMMDLGYKKPHAKRILDDMSSEVDKFPIEMVVKIALQKAAS